MVISLGIMAPVGYFVSPWLLDLVNAAPVVQAEALPYLRDMFVASSGMLVFSMLGGVLLLAFIGSLPPAPQPRRRLLWLVPSSSLVTWTSVGLMGAAAVAGQNLGADQPDRASQAVHVAAGFAMAGAATGSLLSRIPAARQLLGA